jgi:HNH endonuclease
VEDLVRRKFAVARRPRATKGQADESRNIPAEVQRAVYIRDRGRCSFIGTQGRRCGERAFVEFHHLIPYAAGGRTTVENLALRCHAHNAYEAEVFYGPIRDCRSAAEHAGADVVREGTARVTDDAFRSGTTTEGTAEARLCSRSMVWTSA